MAEVVAPTPDRLPERERMVASQVARRGVTDKRVLDAMRKVPREAFVQAGMEEFAYEDSPLPFDEDEPLALYDPTNQPTDIMVTLSHLQDEADSTVYKSDDAPTIEPFPDDEE